MPSYSPLLLLVEQSLIFQGFKFQTERRVKPVRRVRPKEF